MVGRARFVVCAYVREVSPLARVLRIVVVIINFVIGDDGIIGRGGGVEFR